MRRLALLLPLVLAGCLGGSDAPPPAPVALAPESEGRIGIPTSDPYDFADMGEAEARLIEGDLRLPEGTGEARGTVLLSHGAGGRGGRQERMADFLVERGWAALVLDHFGPRDIGSTVRDQLRATEQTMVADLFAARARVLEHPRLAGGPVGAIGWSKGATAVTLAAVERLAGFAGPGDARLDFAVAFYPFCGFDLDDERLATPLLMLLAGEDDWTPAPPCVRQAGAWAAAGQPVEWEVYEGAEHGFDARTWFDFSVGRAITVRDDSPACTLSVGPDGRSGTLEGGHSIGSVEGRVAFLADCGVRGVTFGGDAAARRAAFDRVEAFLARF